MKVFKGCNSSTQKKMKELGFNDGIILCELGKCMDFHNFFTQLRCKNTKAVLQFSSAAGSAKTAAKNNM